MPWGCGGGFSSQAWVNPTVQQFQQQFVRDFPYGTDPETSVLNTDITNAFAEVETMINVALWGSQSAYTLAFNYLAAHVLVTNLRNSTQGMNGQYNWLQNSKTVGPVTESFTIPQRIIDNPEFAALVKTNYGAKYLNMLWPLLTGVCFSVRGRTKP